MSKEMTADDLEGKFQVRIDHNAEPGGDVLDLLADIIIDMVEEEKKAKCALGDSAEE